MLETLPLLVLTEPLCTVPFCAVCGGYAHMNDGGGSPVCSVCLAWAMGVIAERSGVEFDGEVEWGPGMMEA